MKKIKVRIAACVDPTGKWNVCGWGDANEKPVSDDELMGNAIDVMEEGENRYWLEAELEIPEPSVNVIEAKVSAA